MAHMCVLQWDYEETFESAWVDMKVQNAEKGAEKGTEVHPHHHPHAFLRKVYSEENMKSHKNMMHPLVQLLLWMVYQYKTNVINNPFQLRSVERDKSNTDDPVKIENDEKELCSLYEGETLLHLAIARKDLGQYICHLWLGYLYRSQDQSFWFECCYVNQSVRREPVRVSDETCIQTLCLGALIQVYGVHGS